MVMAKVKVNGEYVGGVWSAPYRLNISGFLKRGSNSIEVEVVNCWRNRLIGEKEVIPESERFTFQTSTSLDKDSELQSSGLLGPGRPHPDLTSRVGDYVLLAAPGISFQFPAPYSRVFHFKGHHSGLLPAETRIPLFALGL